MFHSEINNFMKYVFYSSSRSRFPARTRWTEAPQGVVSDDDLNTPENVDKNGDCRFTPHWAMITITSPYTSLWAYGSIRGGDAYKGGDWAGRYQ